MNEEFSFLSFLLDSGVLGLGWIFTIWLARELIKAKNELVEVVRNNTEAMTKLAERLSHELDRHH